LVTLLQDQLVLQDQLERLVLLLLLQDRLAQQELLELQEQHPQSLAQLEQLVLKA
jgi:hypothetical protein